ncbi:inner membrane protein [Salmonella enterica subsp. enterica serovar Heidelberg str. RI-11-014316]|nr:inner membrane protein [Salmonella enterica subsp. enterica serovar Heidelberg str. RI-11-014316]
MGLLGICVALVVAFYYQLVRHELPCPICLLQRAGLIIAGFGFLFNLCFGLRGIHYGMVIIGSILTGVMASRQICLHIMPGDTGYGSAIFWITLLYLDSDYVNSDYYCCCGNSGNQ